MGIQHLLREAHWNRGGLTLQLSAEIAGGTELGDLNKIVSDLQSNVIQVGNTVTATLAEITEWSEFAAVSLPWRSGSATGGNYYFAFRLDVDPADVTLTFLNQPNTYAKIVRLSDSGTSHSGIYVFQVPSGVDETEIKFKVSKTGFDEVSKTLSCRFTLAT